MVKTRFSKAPKKGTKSREILKLSLRKQGVSIKELSRKNLINASSHIGGFVGAMKDMGGWDLVISNVGKGNPVLWCAGRMYWSGGYKKLNSKPNPEDILFGEGSNLKY